MCLLGVLNQGSKCPSCSLTTALSCQLLLPAVIISAYMKITTNSFIAGVEQQSHDISHQKWKTKRWKWRQRNEFDVRMTAETCRAGTWWVRHVCTASPTAALTICIEEQWNTKKSSLCVSFKWCGSTYISYFSLLFGFVHVFVSCFLLLHQLFILEWLYLLIYFFD